MKIDHKDSFPDFGNQFKKDNSIDGYWGSVDLLKDIVTPFDLNDIKDKIIMEVGVGSGRISNNLLKFDPKILYGIEPSKAIEVARKNIKSNKIELINSKGENLNFSNKMDYVFSLGVIHHISEFENAIKKCLFLLKPNAPMLFYFYYAFDNKPIWYKALWLITNPIRSILFNEIFDNFSFDCLIEFSNVLDVIILDLSFAIA